jgi:Uncharacterized protein conserved in bacteria (DUF2242)
MQTKFGLSSCAFLMFSGSVLAALSACSTPPKPLYQTEQFDAKASPFARNFDATSAGTCQAARRALLSQGYMTTSTRFDLVDGTKNFQPDADSHVTIEFHVVCTSDDPDSPTSTAYVSAVQDRYTLKKNSTSASVGLSVIGSLSLPIGSTDDSMVKIASETIPAGVFYDRFFNLVKYYVATAPEKPAPVKPPPPPPPMPDPVKPKTAPTSVEPAASAPAAAVPVAASEPAASGASPAVSSAMTPAVTPAATNLGNGSGLGSPATAPIAGSTTAVSLTPTSTPTPLPAAPAIAPAASSTPAVPAASTGTPAVSATAPTAPTAVMPALAPEPASIPQFALPPGTPDAASSPQATPASTGPSSAATPAAPVAEAIPSPSANTNSVTSDAGEARVEPQPL